MTDKQKQALLGVARKVIEATVKGEAVSAFESEDPLFQEKRGCFVTIHDRGRLRGCIGVFKADKGLLESVREMAIAAVAHDPRFGGDRVRADELENVDVLLIPVGGISTINASVAADVVRQLEPKVVIPMHYKTTRLGQELEPVDRFLKEIGLKDINPQPKLSITRSSLPDSTQVFVLDHIC